MWQAFLLAIGISLCLVGGECLVLDKMILADPSTTKIDYSGFGSVEMISATPRKVVVPPEWAPWVFLASGSMVILYSYSLAGGSSG